MKILESEDQCAFSSEYLKSVAQLPQHFFRADGYGLSKLVASLHAYRLAHKTYWTISREQLAQHPKQKAALQALATLSEFWMELFEVVGALLEEAHADEEARVVAQSTRVHASVIEELLTGTEPAVGEGRQLLTLCGMRPCKKMTVASAQSLRTAGR